MLGGWAEKRLRWGCWKPAEIERISLIHICRVRTFYFVLDSCFSVSGRLIRGGGAEAFDDNVYAADLARFGDVELLTRGNPCRPRNELSCNLTEVINHTLCSLGSL